jgi:hypothetical protein
VTEISKLKLFGPAKDFEKQSILNIPPRSKTISLCDVGTSDLSGFHAF